MHSSRAAFSSLHTQQGCETTVSSTQLEEEVGQKVPMRRRTHFDGSGSLACGFEIGGQVRGRYRRWREYCQSS